MNCRHYVADMVIYTYIYISMFLEMFGRFMTKPERVLLSGVDDGCGSSRKDLH